MIDLLGSNSQIKLTAFEEWNFDSRTARRELSELFGVSTLDGFGIGDKKLGLASAGAIYRYLKENYRTRLDHVTRLTAAESDEYMMLDYSTVRNLELIKNLAENSEKDSLFYAINRTSTAAGARKLKENLLRPFKMKKPILYRQMGVKELYNSRDIALELPMHLGKLPDLERLAGRLGMRKANPRQLAAI